MISVIAGVNGAGKSSLVGARIRYSGGHYFNPDEVARGLLKKDSTLQPADANGKAWQIGFDQLGQAIDNDDDYIFETTLGGSSICARLHAAIAKRVEVRILFCGLSSPELHMERVAARVQNGGHDIPEAKIRERWKGAIHNAMGLIPLCSAVRVFDNSAPATESGPKPVSLFALNGNTFQQLPVADMPIWARPLALVAIKRVMNTNYPGSGPGFPGHSSWA